MAKKKLFVSMGGAGNAVLHTLTQKKSLVKTPDTQCVYINFAKSDIADAYKGRKFIEDYGGTGRSPKKGKSLVRKNTAVIEGFFNTILEEIPDDVDEIVVIASLGGGTGSSLIPTALDILVKAKVPLSLFGILPSKREGVSTMPNAVSSFQEIYNNYILSSTLKSFLVFDNQKIEEEHGINTFDFTGINEKVVTYMEHILDDSILEESSEGYQSLDTQERKRVLYWGKGIADYSVTAPELGKIEELKYESSLFNSKFKLNTTKAVAILILFKHTSANAKEKGYIKSANLIVERYRKLFKNAFMVFGFNFGNKDQKAPIETRVLINGMTAPNSFVSSAHKAGKQVSKLKETNAAINYGDVDLDL